LRQPYLAVVASWLKSSRVLFLRLPRTYTDDGMTLRIKDDPIPSFNLCPDSTSKIWVFG